MKLGCKTDEQKARIQELFGHTSIYLSDEGDGVNIDDWVSFDTLAAVVDYLREPSEIDKEGFEKCWKAYKMKGLKKKALDYWKKLTEKERAMVLPHINAYAQSRDVQYMRDFERYLRDKVFMTVVYNGNQVLYDPTKTTESGQQEAYVPICGGGLSWNDYYKCFIYVGYWDGKHISDGYDDNTRPHGATITLNNGRGIISWDANLKEWRKM